MWELILPQGKIKVSSKIHGNSTAFLIAGGRSPSDKWLQESSTSKNIYCADKGIESCLKNDLHPVLLCGDADSAAAFYWQQAERLGVKILRYNPLKDDTDLQLLLEALPEQTNIIASGIWGGRFDHLYSNVFSLLEYKKKKQVQVVLADEQEILLLLVSGESLTFIPTDAELVESLSLLPLAVSNKVTLHGVKWSLDYAPLLLDHPYAISNIVQQKEVFLQCHQGSVAFYLKYKL